MINKSRLGLLGFGLLALGLVGFSFYNVMTLEVVECENSLVAEYPSASGELKAVVFDRSCGAATPVSTHLSLLKADEAIDDAGGNALSVRGLATEAIGAITWDSEEELSVEVLTDELLIEQDRSTVNVTVNLVRP
ncbi:MAG: hypothetical protein HRU11_07850 [Parvularculaceae bacterium]|nr:hypothetical protein [Parvularculaceae bacterium]